MISEIKFKTNLAKVEEKMEQACVMSGRDKSEVKLLPVTKNWPSEIVSYCKNAGFDRVGENRVQEALSKSADISGMRWDLIGHLQTNKVKDVIGKFSRIQTVDSLKLIQKLQNHCCRLDSKMSILLQVNAGDDPAKFGCSVDQASALLEFAISQDHLFVDGLMTIAPFVPDDMGVARVCFDRLRNLRDRLEMEFNVELKELSMGMTLDMQEAIQAGSTMIRVGSALFGNRS